MQQCFILRLLENFNTADLSTFAIEKQPGLKAHDAINLISPRQLYWNSLYSSTSVVFKVVWLLQGYLNLLYEQFRYIPWLILQDYTG